MFLLRKVLPGWNLWSVGGIGPDLFQRVGHGSVVQPEEGIWWSTGVADGGDKGRGTS